MIFPILSGLISPARAPVTYFLLLLNLVVYLVTYESYQVADSKMDEILKDRAFLETQGSAFAVMISQEPKVFSKVLNSLAARAINGENCGVSDDGLTCRQLLGGLAIRNSEFMYRAAQFDFQGDEVALATWRLKFDEFMELRAQHPSYLWGISHIKPGFVQWISYQFSHSGWLHLFWNMMFLLIFGSFIETKLGGSFVAISYVCGGLAGAWFFSLFSGISASPLVGASGAVSALISLVAFAWLRKEGLRYFYWLLPIQGYFGFIALPSWIVLIVSILPDLSGFVASSEDIGSVAYSAHLGGAALGGLVAVLYRYGLMAKEVEESDESSGDSSDESPNDLGWPDRFGSDRIEKKNNDRNKKAS